MKRVFREHGLTIVMMGLFLVCFGGQIITGHLDYNAEQQEHGESPVGIFAYLGTGHFVEATFENWESEFFQMSAYVLFTVFLYQKGSAESKSLTEDNDVDADPRDAADGPDVPWPVRRGGLTLTLYEYSLTLAFFGLFLVSFVLHGIGGAHEFNAEQVAHGEAAISTLRYFVTAHFWFESFQNWQSEFLSVAAIVVLSIFLRQRGSPESKPVAMSSHATDAK